MRDEIRKAKIAEIDALKSAAGGWSRKSIEKLGLTWPPKKGWRKKLIEDAVNSGEMPNKPDFSNCICDGVGMCSKHVEEMLERFPMPIPELDPELSLHMAWDGYQAARKHFGIECSHACSEIRGIQAVDEAIRKAWKDHQLNPPAWLNALDTGEPEESDGNSLS